MNFFNSIEGPPLDSTLELSSSDKAMLDGAHGEATALAMRILVRSATVIGAKRLVDITSAHIDGCLYHGDVSIDFVRRLVAGGAKVVVPTTLNVGSIDLIHPELVKGTSAVNAAGKQLMELHLQLGCEPTFTCAPYQKKNRPKLGDQIAWAESNAIVFANSVLGARTNRYGDFIDLCAALTGRAPLAGLHRDQGRFAKAVFELPPIGELEAGRDIWFALVGLVVGALTEADIPALMGIPLDATEDELKALGASSASTGAVAMFHAIGVTPEARTLECALGGVPALRTVKVTTEDLLRIRRHLNNAQAGAPLAAVCLGTPHFSLAEFDRLQALLTEFPGQLRSKMYVNTSRFILWDLEQHGRLHALQERGVQLVTDTCTYIVPILENVKGAVMTNSGKMAHYAPSNMGFTMAFASLAECVRSAIQGEVVLNG